MIHERFCCNRRSALPAREAQELAGFSGLFGLCG